MGLFSRRPKALPADLERRARAAGAMCDAGQFAAAELSLSSLFADCETVAGPEHPGTLAVLDLLGSTPVPAGAAARVRGQPPGGPSPSGFGAGAGSPENPEVRPQP